MDLIHIIGILLIAVCAFRGGKKGLVNTLGTLTASVLAILFVYVLNTWALESLLLTMLQNHMLVVARVILCVILYLVIFLILKTLILSLRVLTRLPVIRGLNRFLGAVAGAVYGILLVGIIFIFFA